MISSVAPPPTSAAGRCSAITTNAPIVFIFLCREGNGFTLKIADIVEPNLAAGRVRRNQPPADSLSPTVLPLPSPPIPASGSGPTAAGNPESAPSRDLLRVLQPLAVGTLGRWSTPVHVCAPIFLVDTPLGNPNIELYRTMASRSRHAQFGGRWQHQSALIRGRAFPVA